VFLGFSSALWLAAGWYAPAYLAQDANRVRFQVFFLLAMAGNFGLILAGDIPTFYVGFAVILSAAIEIVARGEKRQ
jgi:multicomponent Na+:H+ antiporter subunit D